MGNGSMFVPPHKHCPHCGMSLNEADRIPLADLLDAGYRQGIWECTCSAVLQGWRGAAGALLSHDIDGHGHCPACHEIPERPTGKVVAPVFSQPAKPKEKAQALGGVPL